MSKSLNALIIEDSEDDTLLLVDQLQQGGYETRWKRVETPESLAMALAESPWDVIFSDFSMPRFNAFDALALVHNTGSDAPFIIVSGTIGEDRAVTAMKAGAHDYILKGNWKRLAPAVERELREAQMRQERRQGLETIRHLAYTDSVTGLPNRSWFLERLQDAIRDSREKLYPLALLLMDLDHFKEVNDTLGHQRGDILLQQVGLRLRSVLFQPDIVARIGGDEFGILLPKLAEAEDVKKVVKKLLDFLEAPFIIEGVPIAVEASVGVVIMSGPEMDAYNFIQQADIAMYHAKQMAAGYALYTPEIDPYSPERLGLMAQMQNAIAHNQLLLHYQPKVEIKSGQIAGSEALIRWQHPNLGFLMPDTFIPTVEHTGLMTPLTQWVLTDSMKYCQGAYPDGSFMPVNVNLSARTLHNPHLLGMVESALAVNNTAASNLTLEITESAIILDPKGAEETLVQLNQMGVRLSIDDFGTGFTSFASIKRMPVNEIKIDKSFIQGMIVDKKDEMIVRSIIDLAHNLGIRVVAEGVETKEIFDILGDFGCDEVQGYYISKPQDFAVLKTWFTTSPWKIGAKL